MAGPLAGEYLASGAAVAVRFATMADPAFSP
jgi:hypothetical protein